MDGRVEFTYYYKFQQNNYQLFKLVATILKISIEQGDTANKKIKQKFQKSCLNLNIFKME